MPICFLYVYFLYTNNSILTNKVDQMKRRNSQKSAILNRLIALNTVWKIIPYSVYFFSCNIDHVLHNNPNLAENEKMAYAEQFEDQYHNCPERFVNFLRRFAVQGNYCETWAFIKLGEHSLQRFTNFQLYFSDPKVNRE